MLQSYIYKYINYYFSIFFINWKYLFAVLCLSDVFAAMFGSAEFKQLFRQNVGSAKIMYVKIFFSAPFSIILLFTKSDFHLIS